MFFDLLFSVFGLVTAVLFGFCGLCLCIGALSCSVLYFSLVFCLFVCVFVPWFILFV